MSESTESENMDEIELYINQYINGNEFGEIESNSESSETSSDRPNSMYDDPIIINSCEELDCESVCSSSSSMVQSTNQWNYKINDNTTSWHFLSGLYKREIGDYNNCVLWSNKVRQSVITVQKLKLSKQLCKHKNAVNSINFNHSGDTLVSGSQDEALCLWDWSKGKCIMNYPGVGNMLQTKFLNTRAHMHIISSTNYGQVTLYALTDTTIVTTSIIAEHENACTKLAVHKELPYDILSCGHDGNVKSIDIREDNETCVTANNILNLRTPSGNNMLLHGIDINPMNPYEFIVYGDEEYIRSYDRRNMSYGPVKVFNYPTNITTENDEYFKLSPTSLKPKNHKITSAVYNYCGTEILASYVEDDLYLLDVYGTPGTYLHQYRGHSNKSNVNDAIFYGPKSEYVASGSSCGHMFIWNKNTEVLVQGKHADDNGSVNSIEAHPHLPILASVGSNQTIKIWEPLNRWHQLNRKKMRMHVVNNRGLTNQFISASEMERVQEFLLIQENNAE